ncbi:MAG: tRNA (adenosine(37)-N6)-dimethylallyltransferase MiaA [Limisphaerales bacterium]
MADDGTDDALRGAWFLAGPTAGGKSAVALELARRLGGEIVSVDSMQVYRGLDVGTAKPAAAELAEVPHHLLDVCDLGEAFDVARFVRLARAAADDIRRRRATPIFCGGTGLYFRAVREGLDDSPSADARLRAELESKPLAALVAELEALDPAGAAALDRHNPRRVVRALEILRLTGRPLADARRGRAARGELPPLRVLRREPADLRGRIERRVDAMFAGGLVGETRRLLDAGLAASPTAGQALGYRQVIEHLTGARNLLATVALVKTRTWQFARRQMTWFRGRPDVAWMEVPAGEPPGDTAARLLAAAGVSSPR